MFQPPNADGFYFHRWQYWYMGYLLLMAAVLDLQNGDDLLGRLGYLPSEWAVAQLKDSLPIDVFNRLKEDRLNRQDENQLAIAMVNVLALAAE
jgi:hypothetical protein